MAANSISSLPFKDWGLGLDRPLLIAGPCSAESREQVLRTAEGIARYAPQVRVFRAGAWKPRTRPGGFEGIGAEALPWLREVKERTGMLTITEVATPQHVDAALNAGIDMLWVGARTTPNPFSVQALADALVGVNIPVFVKNPVNPDLQLWIGALERFSAAGVTRLAAIHRGFHWSSDSPYRNEPMWEFPIRLKAAFPELELICDPSHIAGDPKLLTEIAQQAFNLNFSGLMVESHCDPVSARSDAKQQVLPAELGAMLSSLSPRKSTAGPHLHNELREHRAALEKLDADIIRLLGARMDVAARIGLFKQEHNVAILQPEWWMKVMQEQQRAGQALGVSEAFVKAFMDTVHDESIRRQNRVWEGQELPVASFDPVGSAKD
ncbi:MAG: bifunctional 3-deoxy-7-phosphoheptulonate synthase/chorismate mutase type II [Flavobacteriales bacterium]|nr:bifunctional 3-deoxy-7-phosphoheptulonate synthase/chorismate mutase type II [Flavobacteriales bacterium]